MTEYRPQYGERATPEEQRLAAGLPTVEVPPRAVVETPSPPPARSHPVDRFVTIGLLAYGLVNVIVTGLSYLDFPVVMNQTMRTLGIEGEFSNFAQGQLWGMIAAVVLAVGWSVTVMLSIRRLWQGRVTWWLPLAGAVVTMLVASICIAVPMFGDSAFAAYVEQMAGR